MQFRKGVIRPVRCFVEGWELVKDQYPLFLVLNVFALIIAGAVPLGLLLGASFCGIYSMVLKKMDGKRIAFEDLLKGFEFFVPSLVVTLFLIVPTLVLAVPMMSSVVALMFALVPTKDGFNESLVYTLFATFSVFAILFTLVAGTLHAFVMFAYPLIVEHRLSGWEAFKLSSRAVLANANGVIGIIVCEFILSLIGLALFGVGIYLVVPLMFAAVTVAYRQVFPAAEFVNAKPETVI
jgi:uncharacterized membrane protein